MNDRPLIERIVAELAAREPRRADPSDYDREAAVSLLLRPAEGGLELLAIKRAESAGDPWSGHMAFPGGRIEPDDRDLRHAAERETLEEVGLDLSGAEPLGRLDDLHGHRAAGVPSIMIAAFVYHLPMAPALSLNHEVQGVFWFPLLELHEAARHVQHPWAERAGRSMPGIEVGEPGRHIVWGLTYRFLEVFFQAVGRPLPDRWDGLTAS